jgi:hypothetical protein
LCISKAPYSNDNLRKDEANFVSLYPASPFFGLEKTTAQQFTDDARRRFGSNATAGLDLYPAGSSDDAARASLREAFRDDAAWNAREWALAQTRVGGGKPYLYYFVPTRAWLHCCGDRRHSNPG